MVDTAGILNAYLANLDSRINQLQQPAPQQGGILSGADPVMLSLAAGLLSPTKTGGFGESVAQGLSSAQGPLSDIRKQEAARADKLATLEQARAKLALDYMEMQQGGRGARGDDPSLIAKRNEDAASMLREEARFERDPTRKANLLKRADTYQRAADQILEKIGVSTTEPVQTEQPVKTEQPAKDTKQDTGKTTAKPYTGATPPSAYPDAQLAEDGYWYIKGPDGRRNVRIKVKE